MKKPPLDLTLYFSILMLIILAALYLIMDLGSFQDINVQRFIILGLVGNTVFLFSRFFHLKKYQDHTLLELEKLSYIEDEILTYRQYRHDHKNHLIILTELAKQKEYDELIQYTQQLLTDIDHTYFEFKTGVLELDVLLYSKIQKARSQSIDLGLTINCSLPLTPKAIVDMVSILSNILDNAIDAASTIEIAHERMIHLDITQTTLECILTLTNSFSPAHPVSLQQVFNRGYTTKKDQGNQGLGLSIVKKLVKKWGGNLSLDLFNGVFFQLKIALPKHVLLSVNPPLTASVNPIKQHSTQK